MKMILGQARAIELLTAAIEGGRLHHAWIFHGPAGVGKRTTAEAFAAALLDPTARVGKGGRIECDERGETARLIAAGSHPGLHLINRETAIYSSEKKIRERKQVTIPIEVLRAFLVEPATRSVGGASAEARASKVFIVDEAEALAAPHGQNVLLKTLEEPAAGTIIILVTSQPERLLPTIRSRCRSVEFGRLSAEEMGKWMARRHADLRGSRREFVESFAEGSPGLAEQAIQRNLSSWHEELAPMIRDLWAGKYPAGMGGAAAKMVDDLAKAIVKEKGDDASKDAANRASARFMFRLLAHEASKLMRAAVSKGANPARHLTAIESIRNAEGRLDSNVSMGLLFEELVIAWSEADETAPPVRVSIGAEG